jgi:hypothetical protein
MREQDEELAREGRPALDPSTPVSELRRATQAILSSAWGSCREGEVRHRGDPLVVNLPACFAPVVL